MKKKITILSIGYWFTAYTLGMLLHPYKTVRELVRVKEFGALVMAPTVMWGLMWLVGMVGLRFGYVILVVLGLLATPRFVNILAFIFWWLTTFIIMWQVLVGYLWIRFSLATSGTKDT